jgi:hypothetical protein
MDPGVIRTAGEVGCMVSHISAYQKALQDGMSHLIVFEDDCVVAPGFSLEKVGAYLGKVKRFAAEFSLDKMDECLLLGNCGCYRWRHLTEGIKATDHFNGSHAYIIGRPMMIQMIHTYLQFLSQGKTGPVDGILPLLLQAGRRYAVSPENDTELFRQNRAIPSYIASNGEAGRRD